MKKKELKKLIEGLNKELELMRKQRDQLQERIDELLDDYQQMRAVVAVDVAALGSIKNSTINERN